MNSYFEEDWGSVGLNFNPWDYSHSEKHGILLAIFKNLNILTVLELSPSDMLEFCLDIETLYTEVPYHSFNHAIDVVVKLYYVLNNLQASAYLASYDIACLIIGGICHDAGHPGLNNLFQNNANTELSQRYPDAILERYSMDLAEEYINKHRLFRNVENLRDPMYGDSTVTETDIASRMIFSIRAAILNTDMSRHFEVVEECKVLVSELSKKARCMSKHEVYQRECGGDVSTSAEPNMPNTQSKLAAGSSSTRSAQGNGKAVSKSSILSRARSPSAPAIPKKRLSSHLMRPPCNSTELLLSVNDAPVVRLPEKSNASTENTSEIGTPSTDDSDSGRNSNSKSQTVKRRLQVRRSISMSDALLDSSQRQSLIGIILHAVDIFNPVLPWPMCKKWSDLMNAESFRQGELEKALSLPVSPNMDRGTADQRQVSLDFGSIIVRPFFSELVSLFPVEDVLLPALEANLQKWSRLSTDTSHEISPPAGANSNMYSWPASRLGLSESNPSTSSSFSEGRRLSIAAGTVDIPPSRLEMIRRHSHEGFEALHRRMVGRLFSKHLEKIQERRKVSYTGSNLRLPLIERQYQRPAYIRTTFAPVAGGWDSSANVHAGRIRSNRNFGTDMLSPVTEASIIEDSSAPTSSAGSGTEGGCFGGVTREPQVDSPITGTISAVARDAAHCGQNADLPMSITVDRHGNPVFQGPASASLEVGRPSRPTFHGPSQSTVTQTDAEDLCNYRIDVLYDPASGRQYRSASLDPTILSNMPSTYPSLSGGKSSKFQHEISEG
ncbi:hypothetical protein EV178_001719 [Coemansia sp. RSA 1646]|nr:hypothetical protein EV178_001719 [Coemansia sp. RSA 1646]KAJ2092966.1 hypothetical protein IW138_000680 [Coemansia sp. RSA 986]